jgi:hypothetical protein
LLLVLERPDIPLQNNGAESAIHEFVKKRKISGPARSENGRRYRDTFTSLKKTCKLTFTGQQQKGSLANFAAASVDEFPASFNRTNRRKWQMSERQKTIILTGASQGIGHATAIRFYNAGWRIITCARQAFPKSHPGS